MPVQSEVHILGLVGATPTPATIALARKGIKHPLMQVMQYIITVQYLSQTDFVYSLYWWKVTGLRSRKVKITSLSTEALRRNISYMVVLANGVPKGYTDRVWWVGSHYVDKEDVGWSPTYRL